MTERKTVVASIFETITAGPDELDFTPRESWKDYVRAVVPNETAPSKGAHERKAGLYAFNVETLRLVRDERGWLRVAS